MSTSLIMSGAFAAPDPETCQTMSEVRAGVDEIDRLLAPLIARRQRYMDAAARIKPDRGAVRDEARIAQVLDNVRRHSAEAGLSFAIAEPVWRAMMEACIAYEFEAFDALRGARSQRGG
ncbi:MAG: chorismate mutase [Hydrogenophilaceae bacterium]|jgi:isochorismate pyruvate lyase|nr:chorismate mutase [Hydrogenophilaceae bacterium]